MSVIWAAPEPPGGDRDGVGAAGDDYRDGAGSPVDGLGDDAARRGGDIRVHLRMVACGPRRDDEVRRQGGAVADRVDNDLSLLPGKRAGNGLRHLELAGDESVGVADIRLGDVTGRDGHGLPAPDDVDRHGAGVSVDGLGNRAFGWEADVVVLLGLVTRGSPGGDHKVRGQGLAIALGVDRDLPLLARSRTGDRLPHEQRADVVVEVLDFHRLGSAGAGWLPACRPRSPPRSCQRRCRCWSR